MDFYEHHHAYIITIKDDARNISKGVSTGYSSLIQGDYDLLCKRMEDLRANPSLLEDMLSDAIPRLSFFCSFQYEKASDKPYILKCGYTLDRNSEEDTEFLTPNDTIYGDVVSEEVFHFIHYRSEYHVVDGVRQEIRVTIPNRYVSVSVANVMFELKMGVKVTRSFVVNRQVLEGDVAPGDKVVNYEGEPFRIVEAFKGYKKDEDVLYSFKLDIPQKSEFVQSYLMNKEFRKKYSIVNYTDTQYRHDYVAFCSVDVAPDVSEMIQRNIENNAAIQADILSDCDVEVDDTFTVSTDDGSVSTVVTVLKAFRVTSSGISNGDYIRISYTDIDGTVKTHEIFTNHFEELVEYLPEPEEGQVVKSISIANYSDEWEYEYVNDSF